MKPSENKFPKRNKFNFVTSDILRAMTVDYGLLGYNAM
jgi:hypothetical protein